MTSSIVATNAASSGIHLDRKTLKSLVQRSDVPGLKWLGLWILCLIISGYLLHLSLSTWWVVPAIFLYGSVLTLSGYALSHECAHGTAFRTRWLNEICFWVSSFIYFEEPYHRRYTHTQHHTWTWHPEKDMQMPLVNIPMKFRGWLIDLSGIAYYFFEIKIFTLHSWGKFSDFLKKIVPQSELVKLTWSARIYLPGYIAVAMLILAGHTWLLIYLILPRLAGAPVMLMFGLIQHAEMAENSDSIVNSTRSFTTNRPTRFFYMNMNFHIEHHRYPQVPFFSLPSLGAAISDQLPPPDPGFLRTNYEVMLVAIRRSMGKSTKAQSIRQAPDLMNESGSEAISAAIDTYH